MLASPSVGVPRSVVARQYSLVPQCLTYTANKQVLADRELLEIMSAQTEA